MVSRGRGQSRPLYPDGVQGERPVEYTRYSKMTRGTADPGFPAHSPPAPALARPVHYTLMVSRGDQHLCSEELEALVSGSREPGICLLASSYEDSLAKMRGRKCAYSSEFEKHLQTVTHTSHFSSLPLWRGWYFFTEARGRFSTFPTTQWQLQGRT